MKEDLFPRKQWLKMSKTDSSTLSDSFKEVAVEPNAIV
jgi:hypothetical protein